ncbi:hypothetical protein JCM14036_30430 [Desulfotomaculum defluvii]
MKINMLNLASFRNHQQSSLALDKLNFFVGHNNAGKTSILAAIEWGLTGKCMWTDKAGRGAADLVRQGEKQASVALEVEGMGGIVRTMPPHSLQVGKMAGVNEGQAAILNHLQTDEENLRIALNSSAFLSLSQAEQRSFLFSAYGLNFTSELVAQQLTSWLMSHDHAEETAAKLADQAKAWYPANLTGGPEVLEVMEKRAKELRKDLKKDKQRTEAALEDLAMTIQGLGQRPGTDRLPEIKDTLEKLRSRRDELLKQSSGRDVQTRREKLQSSIQAMEEKIAGVRAKGTELVAKIKEMGEPVELSLTDQINTLRTRMNAHRNQASAVENRLQTLTEAAQALVAADRRCPLAPGVIQCALTARQVEKILANISQEQNAAKEELTRIEVWTQETADELAALEKKQQENQTRAKQYALLQGEIKTQRVLLDQFTADKASLEQELANLPSTDLDYTEYLDEQISHLDKEIQTVEAEVDQIKEAAKLTQRWHMLKDEVKLLTAEITDMETLVKALGPEGLRKKLLAGILGDFLGRVNDCLARLTDGAYQISLAEDILCRANGGPLLPLKLLSKSEQLRVGIAISEALSARAGLRFLAIDEADMLDQENRDLLTGLLLDLTEEYDQILVCTTIGDVQPQNPNLPGVKMFWVEEGKVKEM